MTRIIRRLCAGFVFGLWVIAMAYFALWGWELIEHGRVLACLGVAVLGACVTGALAAGADELMT